MKLFYILITGICIFTFTLLVAQKNNGYLKLLSFNSGVDNERENKKEKNKGNKSVNNVQQKNAPSNGKYSPSHLFTANQLFAVTNITATKTVGNNYAPQ